MLYNNAKEFGITLFTVSHRQTLFKHHDYIIRFDGEVIIKVLRNVIKAALG